jgi:ribosomal protein S18 acetylase RimI-like enzyme
VIVRALTDDDRSWTVATLEKGWGATSVARLGELVDASLLPGLAAVDGADRIGLLTYAERNDGIEIVTIQALARRRGVGSALMDAVHAVAIERAASRIWLITTNDNGPAFRFYQRCGLDLCRLIRNGVEASRRVKPSIPVAGADGIPIRHELEFELIIR